MRRAQRGDNEGGQAFDVAASYEQTIFDSTKLSKGPMNNSEVGADDSCPQPQRI